MMSSFGMKRLGHIKLLVSCLFFSSMPTFSCSLTLAVSSDFPPHHIKDLRGHWSGVSIDLARMLVEQAGCDLDILDVPWTRAIKLLEVGDVHLLTNFSFNLQRSKFAQFLGPHYIEKAAFLARNDISENVNDVQSLQDFKGPIGLTRGASFGLEFEKAVLGGPVINRKLVYLNKNKERYLMLVLGRLDAVFDDALSARYLLATESEGLEKDRYNIRFTLDENPVYFAVNPISLSSTMREKLNTVWESMLRQNVVSSVYSNYGLEFHSKELEGYQSRRLDIASKK
jgi:polar amino acid transport system substrate-binding protein